MARSPALSLNYILADIHSTDNGRWYGWLLSIHSCGVRVTFAVSIDDKSPLVFEGIQYPLDTVFQIGTLTGLYDELIL